jgi:hypothetical protein
MSKLPFEISYPNINDMNLPSTKRPVEKYRITRNVRNKDKWAVNAPTRILSQRNAVVLRLILGTATIEVVGQFYPYDYKIWEGETLVAHISTKLTESELEIQLLKTNSLLRPELLDQVCHLIIAEPRRPEYPHYSYSFQPKGWNFRITVAHNKWMQECLRVLGFKPTGKRKFPFGPRMVLPAKNFGDLADLGIAFRPSFPAA